MSAFLLVVGKVGPKFQESQSEGESEILPDPKRMAVAVRRVPVSQLVDQLSRMFRTPVIDLTGLTGRYDLSLEITKYIPQVRREDRSALHYPDRPAERARAQAGIEEGSGGLADRRAGG
jgi:uncharacterized protein (TIGR03435 family)